MNQHHHIVGQKFPDSHHDIYSRTVFGFWIYLLTDFVLFGTLFASYVVLRKSTFGGAGAKELFDLHPILTRTIVLLLASFCAGLGGASAHRRCIKKTLAFFSFTFLLGILFMAMQYSEFHRLVANGHGWETSAFLSAYFTLLGTYAAHIVFGLLWILILVLPICFREISPVDIRRLSCLRMFWQFLNIVWIFVFTFVYLIGAQ